MGRFLAGFGPGSVQAPIASGNRKQRYPRPCCAGKATSLGQSKGSPRWHALVARHATPDANSQLSDANSQLSDANSQLSAANSQLSETNSQFSDANSQLSDANSRLSDANSQLSDAKLGKRKT